MAKVTIGTKSYTIDTLNFAALERAWPFIEVAQQQMDPIQGASAAISVIAAGIMESDGFNPAEFGIEAPGLTREDEIFELVQKFLKKKLLAPEIPVVKDCILDILKEAGMIAEEGEIEGEENLSMVTSPASSPSSSLPDVKVEAGTVSEKDGPSPAITS